jgi:hypothetical protein
MASSTPFDGTNFKEHQATKKSMEFVNNKEHEAIASDPSASGGGGVHKNGSGVAYISSSAATNRPDGSTALAANDIDKGRLWLDDTTTPPALKRWSGSAWVSAGTVVLKDDSFQAVDQAGTGLVPLIGANASDKPELPDGAVATTQAVDDNSTKVATTEYVESQVDARTSGFYTADGVTTDTVITTTSFKDVDTGIGASALAFLKVTNNSGGNNNLFFKQKDDPMTPTNSIFENTGASGCRMQNGASAYIVCSTDSNGLMEVKTISDTPGSITITVIGYIK